MEEHYQILGLETTATFEEVETKFNILYKEYDPETQTDDLKEFFKQEHDKVQEAYKEICLHLIREKEEKEEIKEKEKEEFDWEEDKDKVIKEKEDQEYRRTIHDNDDESDLKITNEGKEGLDKIVYWSKFLSVIGYIALGILSIYAFYLFIEWISEPDKIRVRDRNYSEGYERYDRPTYSYRNNYRKEDLFFELAGYVIFIIIWFFPRQCFI